MKKLAYFIALLAFSTAALAEGNHDRCDSGSCLDKQRVYLKRAATKAYGDAAFTDIEVLAGPERSKMSEENRQGSRD